jgi:hypothetical protein
MECSLQAEGRNPGSLSPGELETAWQQAKEKLNQTG